MTSTPPIDDIPLPPPGLNYIAAIRPCLNLLIIGTVWSAVLIPILVALFFFSTKHLRRKPIFIFNVISILLGIAMGIFSFIVQWRAILQPDIIPTVTEVVAVAWLVYFIPIFVESILIFRIVGVYPPQQTPCLVLLSVFVPLAALKIARLANIIVFIRNFTRIAHAQANPVLAGQLTGNAYPGQKIEWFLQLIDNSAASAIFLWKLNKGRILSGRTSINGRRGTYVSRLQGLFWISVSNFVFPVILCLAQLIYIFRDPSYMMASYIFLTNDYVEIIGVLLATIWTAGDDWSCNNESTQDSAALSHPIFRRYGTSDHTTRVGVTTELGNRDAVLTSRNDPCIEKNTDNTIAL
ncbi:hypothetical protein BDQ12DRAFT_635510 [Crucibulum laeve]|uniref:Fungal pheromone STE3G-protein-coupled receptor n=1 Tax=Crucibulum laeve TaxID=68775 RepID=A0A5C3LPH8_9AGAR|nr:hypothetical protein BDQ12DRAFT_635510 [Crucibulum laeve]